MKAVFDVRRGALSNEAKPEIIMCADLTKLPDLGGHAFLGWEKVPSKINR